MDKASSTTRLHESSSRKNVLAARAGIHAAEERESRISAATRRNDTIPCPYARARACAFYRGRGGVSTRACVYSILYNTGPSIRAKSLATTRTLGLYYISQTQGTSLPILNLNK